jgi:prevent-host-death family protein
MPEACLDRLAAFAYFGHNYLTMSEAPFSHDIKGKRSRRPQNGVAVAEFKARCLELFNRVREAGAEYVITKHGRPVARVVPYRESAPARLFGSMRGTVLGYDRPFDPIDGVYDINK